MYLTCIVDLEGLKKKNSSFLFSISYNSIEGGGPNKPRGDIS